MRVVSVWQTTVQDHGKAAARWSIRTLLRAEMTLARRNFSKFATNASTVLRYCQGRLAQQRHEITPLAQAAPRHHAFGTGNATPCLGNNKQPFQSATKPQGNATQRHARVATPRQAAARSSFAARPPRKRHARLQRATKRSRQARRNATVAGKPPDLCTHRHAT